MKYTLRIQLHIWPADTIIEDDGYSWVFPGSKSIDHRGSIREGELAMLLDSARDRGLTSILEPMEEVEHSES